MPTFKYDGVNYYCVNQYTTGDVRVVTNHELHIIIKDWMGIDRYGFCDYKNFDEEWFEKNVRDD